MMKKKYLLVIGAALIASALVLGGCSKKDGDSGSGGGDAAAKPAASKSGSKVVIPAEIEGYPVVAISSYAFEEPIASDEYQLTQSGRKRITSVFIPDSVTEIDQGPAGAEDGAGIFSGCAALTSVTLSNNLKVICSEMFAYCTSLESITIPESVTYIGFSAFRGCSSLAEVKLPGHPIGYSDLSYYFAFENCPKLSLATRKAITDSGYTGEF
jgi:hypothetical protein